MSRTTQELLIGGRVQHAEFETFLRAFTESPYVSRNREVTLLLLEKQPQTIVSPGERQDLLLFSELPTKIDMVSYTSGRIFNASGELRWEKQASHIHIVYTGNKAYAPVLNKSRVESLAAYKPMTRRYFLFGKRLDPEQIERIGRAAHPGDFAEVRIPRLLRYPALPQLADASYIKLMVCEYVDPLTGANMAYRFKGLVPCKKLEEQKQR